MITMDNATKKIEIIKLLLSLEDDEMLSFILECLQPRTPQHEEPTFSDEESDELLERYNQKIADVQTDAEMKAVLAEFTEEEQFSIVLMLRAKEARENRDESREMSKVFARIRKKYGYAEKV